MTKPTTDERKEKLYARIAFCVFLIYALLGLFLFDDYGCGPDEGMERQTSLVNFRYVLQKLNIPIDEENETWLAYLPELKDYRDRYYGTALHFPLVLIESMFHFSLEPAQFYGMRHFYTFLWYFVGTLCFYRLLSNRFGSKKFGIIGVLMLILSPRFFAESFYNNKDVLFMSWYVICIFVMDHWFRDKGLGKSVLLAFVMALTINTRFNGIIFIALFVVLNIFDALRYRKFIYYEVRFILVTLILTGFFFYLMTPNFWDQPIQTLAETLQFNMRHPNHGSEGNLFFGSHVDAARTWQFIPVWIMLTVPTVYLLFSCAGTVWAFTGTVRDVFENRFRDIVITDLLFAGSGYAAVLFIILTHVTIYNGWRHCYFAYPCILFFAVYFINKLNCRKIRIVGCVCAAILMLSMVYQAFWIVKNHPFEYVYFVPAARSSANQFSGDYWSVSSRALLEYIAEIDPDRMLLVNHKYSQAGSINRGLLPGEKRQYIDLTYEKTPDVDYYIVCRDDIPDVHKWLPGYEKIFSLKVDDDEFAAVYGKETESIY